MPTKTHGALTAWELAIKHAYLHGLETKQSIEDLARSFGQAITDQAHLDLVSQIYDWNNVQALIKHRL